MLGTIGGGHPVKDAEVVLLLVEGEVVGNAGADVGRMKLVVAVGGTTAAVVEGDVVVVAGAEETRGKEERVVKRRLARMRRIWRLARCVDCARCLLVMAV